MKFVKLFLFAELIFFGRPLGFFRLIANLPATCKKISQRQN